MKAHLAGSANGRWKGGRTTLQCGRCASPFTVKNCHKDRAKYCSLECFNLFQKETAPNWVKAKRGENLPANNKGKRRAEYVRKPCRECATAFEARPSVAIGKHFCSLKCQFRWRRKRMKGAGNPTWAGGTSRDPYPHDWRETSRRIVERDGRKCQNPGCQGKTASLDVHHIDYDKQNCADPNLITLCGSCHSRSNYDRPRWRVYYVEIQAKRFAPERV